MPTPSGLGRVKVSFCHTKLSVSCSHYSRSCKDEIAWLQGRSLAQEGNGLLDAKDHILSGIVLEQKLSVNAAHETKYNRKGATTPFPTTKKKKKETPREASQRHITHLHRLAIQFRIDLEVLRIPDNARSDDPRAVGSPAVKPLAEGPLAASALDLPFAVRDVVPDGVAQDVVECLILRHVRRSLAHDNDELALVV